MKSVEIVGFNRNSLGKKPSRDLRLDSLVPCVLYGGETPVHFMVPMILFRDIVYSPNAYIVDLNIEGKKYRCILQDVQFHPVNEMLLHADFLQLFDDKPVKMEIPVKLTGTAVGVTKGGKLVQKLRKLKVQSLPAQLPDAITVDVSELDLGKTVKVGAIKTDGYKILNVASVPVCSVDIPRALKGKMQAN